VSGLVETDSQLARNVHVIHTRTRVAPYCHFDDSFTVDYTRIFARGSLNATRASYIIPEAWKERSVRVYQCVSTGGSV